MMKFFRKYMKHFLVAGTVFLMIAFVGGTALTDWLAPDPVAERNEIVRGQAFGRDVTYGDMQPAFSKADIIDRIIPVPFRQFPWVPLLNLDQQSMQMLQFQDKIRTTPLTDEEWYMLLLDCERDGVYVSDQEIAEYKESFGLTPERIARVSENLRVSTLQIDEAVAAYARVMENANQVLSAAIASEADIQNIIRQTGQKVEADALIVASENFIDPDYMPTDEEIQEHYEEYEDEPAQPMRGGAPFGYQEPEEVKIEYIHINADALAEKQTVSDDEAYEYWAKAENKNRFFKPQTQPAEGEKPAPREPYATFSEARQDVIARLKTEKARSEALSVARDLIARLSAPWADQPATQPGGYKEIPESVRGGNVYPDLVESLRNAYPDTLTFVRTDYKTLQELNADSALSGATSGSGRSGASLARAAFFVQGSTMTRESVMSGERLFRNLYETVRDPFVGGSGDYEGDVYIMRTVDIHPPQAPPLDEIRDQVIADVRKKRAYEQAEKAARDLAARITKENKLREAFLADEALLEKVPKSAFREPEPFPLKSLRGNQLSPPFIPEFGYDPAMSEEIAKVVEEHKAKASHPVMVYEQENQGRWLVIQIDRILPVTEKTYEDVRQSAMRFVSMNMMIDLTKRWFDPEQIRARVEWKDAEGQSEEGPDAGEEQAAEEEPA